MLVDPAVGLRRQRRTGRAERTQRREVGDLRGLDAGLDAAGEVRGPRTEEGRADALDEAPQHAEVRRARMAVVQHGGSAGQQSAHLHVPHDPAGGRVPEEAVARPDVTVQVHALHHLEQHAGVAVHDRLRQPRRTRRIHDPQRMVGRHLLGPQHRIVRDDRGPAARLREARRVQAAVQQRHDQRVLLPSAARRGPRPAPQRGRTPCRRSGSRRRRSAPSARSGGSDRARQAAPCRANTPTRSRPRWRRRGRRRSSAARSAGLRRRGHPGRRRTRAAPLRPRPPATAALPTRPHAGRRSRRRRRSPAVCSVACRKTWSTRFSRAPTNHCAPGIVRAPSTRS